MECVATPRPVSLFRKVKRKKSPAHDIRPASGEAAGLARQQTRGQNGANIPHLSHVKGSANLGVVRGLHDNGFNSHPVKVGTTVTVFTPNGPWTNQVFVTLIIFAALDKHRKPCSLLAIPFEPLAPLPEVLRGAWKIASRAKSAKCCHQLPLLLRSARGLRFECSTCGYSLFNLSKRTHNIPSAPVGHETLARL